MNVHCPNLRLVTLCLLIAGGVFHSRVVSAQEAATAVPDTARDTSKAVPITSVTLFRGGLLRELPIDDPRQAFVLAPGVLMRGGEIGIATAPALSLRGGDLGAASVYIDGAPVRFQTLGTQQLALATSAISRVAVVTGPTSALVADASGGGLISYVTRAGGSRFAGRPRGKRRGVCGRRHGGLQPFRSRPRRPIADAASHLVRFSNAARTKVRLPRPGQRRTADVVMGGLDGTVTATGVMGVV
jgi:outer membrane receptor protein involved in Fe transport